MFKFLLSFSFIFFVPSPFSFASSDAVLKTEYGQDLTHAPFFLRFAFEKKYGKDWKDSDYSERSDFLKDYQTGLRAEKVEERAEAKADADKEKERLKEHKKELRLQQQRLAAELAEEKADKDDYSKRQKQFEQAIAAQQGEIQQMQEQYIQEKQSPQNNR